MRLLFKYYYKAFAIILTTFICSCCGGSNGGSAPDVIDIPPSADAIKPSELPTLSGTHYQYKNGNQQFSAQNMATLKAIGVATFQNDSSSSGEGDLKIKNVVGTSSKKEDLSDKKMLSLMETDSRFKASERNNISEPMQYSERDSQKKYKTSEKSHRASDAIGTRDTFYHDEGKVKGQLAFEKLYSGKKCLIYSEVNTATDTPYVTPARGKIIGDAFEVSNPFHPTGKPVFDVVTSLFGNPWGIDENGNKINGGGRDGEEQVIFLLYKGGSSYGYFFWVDEEPKGFVNPDGGYVSNGAEIVYLNQIYANDDIAIISTIAHEFQHLCDYNQKFVLNGAFNGQIFNPSFDAQIPTMFNEGQSVLSEDLNGFSLDMSGGKGNDFIFNTVDSYRATISSFTPSFYTWKGGSDYGKGYLFWRFLYDTYGESKIKTATHSSLLQPANIEIAIGKKMDVLLQEFLLALMETESTPSTSAKITTIDPKKNYFNTKGKSIGVFQPLDYVTGFTGDSKRSIPANIILSDSPYVIRLYKLFPSNNEVSFTIENIKSSSSYSIFTAIIDH